MSVRYDLTRANNDIDLIMISAAKVENGQKDPSDDLFARSMGGLICQALLLYTRATASGKQNRHSVSITRGWSQPLLKRHDRIKKIRNNAIAHFGPGIDRPDLFWVKETPVFARLSETSAIFQMAAVRLNYRSSVVDDLMVLVPEALESALKIYLRIANTTMNELNNLKGDDELSTILRDNIFEGSTFFPATSEYEDFIDGMRGRTPRSRKPYAVYLPRPPIHP
jgi:hypothetical protein